MDFDSEFIEHENGLESDGDSDHPQAHVAAASGDVPLLVQAVQHDPGVIQQLDGDGFTPLAHAVHGQHIHAVKRLIKMGADVNAQDSQGRSYLSIAAYQGWSEGVIYLLRNGAKQNIVDKSGRTPLHASTYDIDSRSLVALLKRLPKEDVNSTDNEKMTALHWAVFHDRPEHVRHLIHKGAEPLLQDIDGKTALHWSAQNGSRSCCYILLDHSDAPVLLTTVDNSGKNAAHLAAAAGKATILSDLAKVAPDLLEADDMDERTPLHWSAAMGHANCIKAMLDLGVNPSPNDVDGVTPLEYARQARRSNCVAMLEERLGIRQNNKIKASRDSTRPSETKKASVGFFKGLFGKKSKLNSKSENTMESKSEQLPKVSISGVPQMPRVVNGSDDRNKRETSKTITQDIYGRGSSRTTANTTLNYLNSDDASGMNEYAVPNIDEQTGHRKRKKKHKKKSEREHDGLSSPSTYNTTSTWNDEPAMGDHYIPKPSNTRTTHLSPLGNVRPPSISPRLTGPNDHNVLVKRQGELSPLRINRIDNDQAPSPLPSHLGKLRASSSRSPTPPPFLSPVNINTRKALPQISPLTKNMDSLLLEKKQSKSRLKHEHETGNVFAGLSETPEASRNFVNVSEENGQVHSPRLNMKEEEILNSGYVRPIERYPSDDAVSLYKLSYTQSNVPYDHNNDST